MGRIIFTTERVIVRQYEFEKDADNFFLLNGDEEVMRYIRPAASRPHSDAFLRKVIESYKENPLMGRWASFEKDRGSFIGSFAFIPVEGTQNSQLGYALLKKYWGRGFATEMMLEGIKYVFEKTDLTEVYGITEIANVASQNVLMKVGFSLFKEYEEKDKILRSYILNKT